MNGGLNIDLHTHSNCSDGALTPAELVARAAAAGVEVLALTDHDTVAGLTEADQSAGVHGLRLVPGVEISASWRAQAIHVLGLWIDPASAELRSVLEMQAERRRARMREICARLEKLGLPGPLLLAAVEAHPGLPTRAHLANAMVAGGHVSRADEAFRRYLGAGKPANVAAEWPALDVVVGWIRAAGGVAALAHPARYALSAGARRQMVADFELQTRWSWRQMIRYNQAFANVRPHLSAEYMKALAATRTLIASDETLHDSLASKFLSELDRLEREWKLS